MKYVLCLLIFLTPCFAQEAPTLKKKDIPAQQDVCVHESDEDFYDNIRHTGIVYITHVTGVEVTVLMYRKNLIEYKTFQMSPRSRVPKDFYQVNPKRKWFFLYCLKHNFLLVAEPLK